MENYEKSECSICYYNFTMKNGVFTCLDCGQCFCSDHLFQHSNENSHYHYVHNKLFQSKYIEVKDGAIIECPPKEEGEYLSKSQYVCQSEQPFYYTLEAPTNNVVKSMVCGFGNLGLTCYMNTTLHVIFAIQEFSDYCYDPKCDSYGPLGHQLHRFMIPLYEAKHPVLFPKLLRKAINAGAPIYNEMEPQDSLSYFHYLFPYLNNNLPSCPLNLVTFNLKETRKCPKCGHTITKKTQHYHIGMPVIDTLPEKETFHTDIISSIRAGLNPPETFICPECDYQCFQNSFPEFYSNDVPIKSIETNTFVSKEFETIPKYLFITHNLDIGPTNTRYKRLVDLQFNKDDIDLTDVVGAKYQLKAFSYHMGRWAKLGHDMAFVKYDNEWIFFNDIETSIATEIVNDFHFGAQYLYLLERKE